MSSIQRVAEPAPSFGASASLNATMQAYAELQGAFDHYNARLFDGRIPPCLITMQREKRTYGYFSHRRFAHRTDKNKAAVDEIAINPSYFGVVPLLEILQTVVHEMAHAWQFHHGTPGRRGYHNKEWADKMEAIGLMPSATGKPGGARTGEHMADYAIEGGPFMQATAALLAAGFQVSWIDRFPPRVPAALSAAAVDAGDDVEPPTTELVELAELAALVEPPPPGNRSNRIKYRCPECGAQVWGKPGLRVLCGGDDCGGACFAAT